MKLIKAIFQFLISTIRHKRFVYLAGRKFMKHIPLHMLLLHDHSKFNPVEFINYAKYYKITETEIEFANGSRILCGKPGAQIYLNKEENQDKFLVAWMHHQKTNKHHPEYWQSSGVFYWADGPVNMPTKYVREWVADLLGASMEYTGSWDISEWLLDNYLRYEFCNYTTKRRFVFVLSGLADYPETGITNSLLWTLYHWAKDSADRAL